VERDGAIFGHDRLYRPLARHDFAPACGTARDGDEPEPGARHAMKCRVCGLRERAVVEERVVEVEEHTREPRGFASLERRERFHAGSATARTLFK
jgi:hypothetical protein